VAYRAYLLTTGTPPTNSDEATMGLAALHISTGREFPVFFYGQAYMGTLEAYLAAPLFWLFGPSTTALRLPVLVMYAGFAAGAYVLTRLLYPRGLALFTVALLALGSDRVIKNQMIAGGGYPEINAAGVWLLVLSVALATGRVRLRPATLAVWGTLVGLLVWVDWLILPYVAAAALVLLMGCRSGLRAGRHLAALAGGFLVGAAPLVVHHLTRPLSENSISVFLTLSRSTETAGLGDRAYGGLVFGIPMGTGVCAPSRCHPWQLWWSAAFLALLVTATVLAVRTLRAGPEPRRRTVELARLGLLAAAALSIVSYARSSAAASDPVENARYLSATLISLPAVLWPLWTAVTGRRDGQGRRIAAGAAAVVLAGIAATAVAASAALVARTEEYADQAARRRQLVAALEQRDIRRVYGDYWTCNLVTFATRERIVCAVLSDGLHPGLDRYRPYRAEVGAADRPSFVMPVGHALDDRVRTWLETTGTAYRSSVAGGYRIYQPAASLHPR
jgi:hypothetical protein